MVRHYDIVFYSLFVGGGFAPELHFLASLEAYEECVFMVRSFLLLGLPLSSLSQIFVK